MSKQRSPGQPAVTQAGETPWRRCCSTLPNPSGPPLPAHREPSAYRPGPAEQPDSVVRAQGSAGVSSQARSRPWTPKAFPSLPRAQRLGRGRGSPAGHTAWPGHIAHSALNRFLPILGYSMEGPNLPGPHTQHPTHSTHTGLGSQPKAQSMAMSAAASETKSRKVHLAGGIVGQGKQPAP